ncbi:MAG: hypothetical protein CME18_10305 [Gemmatimonadetes bacterium]|nr:hypothetical protein [Gemmatimonadota bacterium]
MKKALPHMNIARADWFRLGSQFLVIIAGITVSLAADRWRQGIEDRETERTLLSGLEMDLKSDAEELELLANFGRRWDETAQWVNHNENRPDIPKDSISIMFQPFGLTTFYAGTRATYSSGISAGEVSMILEDSLRTAVINYYEVEQPSVIRYFTLVFDNWRKWYNVSARYLNWTILPSDTTMRRAIARTNLPELREPWETISSDATLMGHIDISGMMGGDISNLIDQVMAANQALRKQIRAYLEG